ncbi:Translation initiation factor eIF-2B subunit gamma [Dispira simplex]|nr:Translation initiation factor eIF-2B subunit gamma [Dispira simplex]
MFLVDQTGTSKYQIVPEFQAIILAGNKGHLYPLATEDNVPKALLPVANQPMISYTLQWLEQAEIQDVIVVVCPSSETQLTHYLRTVYEGSANIDIVVMDEYYSTAEALRHIASRIFREFVVMTCDTVLLSSPQPFFDAHRSSNPALSALFFHPTKSEGGGGSTKDSEWPLYVGMDPREHRLLYLKQGERVKENLDIRTSLLEQFQRFDLLTNLQDAHVYIFQRWVLDFILAQKHLPSIQKDVLPLLVKCQYRSALAEAEGLTEILKHAKTHTKYIPSVAQWTTKRNADPQNPDLRCNIYIEPKEFVGRATSIPSYCDINKQISKMFTDQRVHPTAEVHMRSQVGADSMVGNETKLDERCSVKRSVIGAHCTIGKNVKIVNSILMDYVTVEDGVKLEGCVLCNNVKIMTKAQLKDCEVGAGLVVDPGAQAKNERIVSSFVEGEEQDMQINFA